ncbi:MAG: filamentous hemagglutinin N-terminal domain-containing protein [Scytonema hyalinum WJT4-NPBG1]|jgi:filamentous hemagglutinin family protein|nr:filamentous hemagglutinin N-terminal domain-containing protein [Scytonema hyalinum WJT4-NPBG1]
MGGLRSTCWGAFLGMAIAGVYTLSADSTQAQITPDATLPNNSIVNINGNIFNITGGTQAGTNLFHSFQQFSVPTGGGALFNNTVDIQNIISRVTGGSISNIDGLIRTLGTANLFLINPQGIVFGPNASLNIGGSFIASTANSINFADGTKFSATPSQDLPLLTITAPVGLNMGSNPGSILVQGPGHDINYENIVKAEDVFIRQPRPPVDTSFTGLQVKSGQTLALVGGNVSFEGGILKSPSGRIEIGSVGSNGSVSLLPIQQGWKLSYDTPSFGDIQFSQKTFVSTTGVGGGSIAMTGRNINFTQQSIVQGDTLGDRNGGEVSVVGQNIGINESNIRAHTYSLGSGGQIKLVASNITFENQNAVSTQASSTGDSGQVNLVADNITFNDTGVGSAAWGTGKGGQINLVANNNITMKNNTNVVTEAWGTGDAGNINIRASSFSLLDSGVVISTERDSTGKAGDINIQVAGPMVVKSAGILSDTVTDNAGKVSISANSLEIESSGVFSRTGKPGKVGEINLQVADSLEVRGTGIGTVSFGNGDAGNINISANSFLLEGSGIDTYTNENSRGNAGDINIRVADSLVIKYAGILSDTSNSNAGNINISANSLQIEDSGVFSRTIETGNAGDINIQVAGSFVTKGTGISTDSYGVGDGGKLNISANALQMDGSQIRSATGANATGNAGEINIQANRMELRNRSSVNTDISGKGNAGNISIVADTIELDNESEINAKTTTGQGGNIGLEIGNLLLLRRGSFISTTAGTAQQPGDGGNITINTPNGFIVGVRGENSDISANAYTGIGGRVDIKAFGIYGIQPRQSLTSLSDITASSEFGVDGTVELNTPDIDPNRGLVELPTNFFDVSQRIDTSCNPGSRQRASSFLVTGRGGIPASPLDMLTPDAVQVDWVSLNPSSDNRKSPSVTSKPTTATPEHIVEATGWVINSKGEVVLTANPPTITSHGSWQNPVSCSAF